MSTTVSPRPSTWGRKRLRIEQLLTQDPRRSPEDIKALMAAEDTKVTLDYVKDIVNHKRAHWGSHAPTPNGTGPHGTIKVVKDNLEIHVPMEDLPRLFALIGKVTS